MSTIGVKYHDEDIHNVVPRPISSKIKSPRYKTKRTKDIKRIYYIGEDRTTKYKYSGHQTFGLAHYKTPESWNYLKKSKPKSLPQVPQQESKHELKRRSPRIPKNTYEKPKPEKKKNFVKENIKKAIALQPKVPVPRKVETPRGTVKDMAHLIQMIKIRDSDKYGKLPKYLCRRRQHWAIETEKRNKEERLIKEYKEKMGIGTMGMTENVYMIDQETRQKLLNGLKENWDELSKQFLKLPVLIDTLPKIKRKMWLEKEIDQIEKDVRLIENHPYIYLERLQSRPWEEIIREEILNKTPKQEKEIPAEAESVVSNKNKPPEKKEEEKEDKEEAECEKKPDNTDQNTPF